jgi:hypothetical protein
MVEMSDLGRARQRLLLLADLLLDQAATDDDSKAPHPLVERFIELAQERPALMLTLECGCQRDPRLIADLLLSSETAPWAAILVASSENHGGFASDRDLLDEAALEARLESFRDAMAVIGFRLHRGMDLFRDIGSLLGWLHERTVHRHWNTGASTFDPRFLASFWSELSSVPGDWPSHTVTDLVSRLGDSDWVDSPAFSAALDMVSMRNFYESDTTFQAVAEGLVNRYFGALQPGINVRREWTPNPSAAHALAKLAIAAGDECWTKFLRPFNFETEAHQLFAEDPLHRFEQILHLELRVRTHLRVLSGTVSEWEAELPPLLVEALERLIRAGAFANLERGRVAAFAVSHESGSLGHSPLRPLAVDVARIFRRLPAEEHSRFIRALTEIDEPVALVQLCGTAPPSVRNELLAHLELMSPEKAGEVWSLPEAHTRIVALVEAGLFDAAEKFIEQEKEIKTLGVVDGRVLFRFKTELHLALLRKRFDDIETRQIPEGLDIIEEKTAREILEFYQGLAELERKDGDIRKAEGIFTRLNRQQRHSPTHALNLHAAKIRLALPNNGEQDLSPQARRDVRAALQAGEDLMAFVDLKNDPKVLAFYVANRATIHLALRDAARALEEIDSLPSAAREEPRAMALAVFALARLDRPREAESRLARAIELHGEKDILVQARAEIASQSGSLPGIISAPLDLVEWVKEAILRLPSLCPEEQVVAWSGRDNMTVSGFLIDHVRSALASLAERAPILREGNQDRPIEDHLTSLLKTLIEHQVEKLEWTVGQGTPGGLTSDGNPGIRDIVVQRNTSRELAVIEAVVCDRNLGTMWTQGDFTSHFQKSFAYGACPTIFIVVYSYLAEPKEVLNDLKRIASEKAPPGFPLRNIEELSDRRNNLPPGFISYHDGPTGLVEVVHLVVDLAQAAQREAARLAAESNPRKKKKSESTN